MAYDPKYYLKNKDKIAAATRKWRASLSPERRAELNAKANAAAEASGTIARYRKSEKGIGRRRSYYELNKERIQVRARQKRKTGEYNHAASSKRWREKNPDKWKALMERRAYLLRKSALTPEIYRAMPVFSKWAKQQGLKIDHIIPIRSPNVCGLNVPWNIQAISEVDNRFKLNWFCPKAYKLWLDSGCCGPLLRPE